MIENKKKTYNFNVYELIKQTVTASFLLVHQKNDLFVWG